MKYLIAILMFAGCIIPAAADVITILPATGIANALTEENSWITSNFGAGASGDIVTTFENLGYGPYTSLITDIGTFSTISGGSGSTGSGTGGNTFTILNSSDSPFNGRYNTTPAGKSWLDSNDINKLQLTTTATSLFFFITDANDQSGHLKIQTADGTIADFPTGNSSGDLFFVGITSADPIGTIQWLNTSTADGFGLDDFGIVQLPANPVPEPASWPGAAAALLIVAAAVRLRARSATVSAPPPRVRRAATRSIR